MTKSTAAENGGSAIVVDQDGRVVSAAVNSSARATTRSETPGFAEIGFAVGDSLQVSAVDSAEHAQHVLRLMGWRAPLSLMLEDSDGAGNTTGYKVQEHLQLRFFSRQHAFQFEAQVLRVCRTPFPYLHLTFPAQVVRSVKRTAPRVATELIVSISRLDSKRRYLAGGQAASLAGLLLDLSPNGAQIQAKEALGSRGARLMVRLRVKRHGLDAVLTLTGRIRSLRRSEARRSGDAVLHGIQFEDMDIRDRLILQSMMYEELLLTQAARVVPLAAPGSR